jgi:hypothetical protein
MDSPSGFRFDMRRAAMTAVLQLALVGAAVGVSQLDLPVRTSLAIVLALTGLNGLIVAMLLLGLRGRGPMVSLFAIIVVIFVIGLLGWPAWDVYERVRP